MSTQCSIIIRFGILVYQIIQSYELTQIRHSLQGLCYSEHLYKCLKIVLRLDVVRVDYLESGFGFSCIPCAMALPEFS